MLWICQKCGHEFQTNLTICPKCRKTHKTAKALQGLQKTILETAERMTRRGIKPPGSGRTNMGGEDD